MERRSISPAMVSPQPSMGFQPRKFSEQRGRSPQRHQLQGRALSPRSILHQEYYPKTPTHTSKVSTRQSHLSRRSSLNDVKSVEVRVGSPREDPTAIFSLLSHLLQNEDSMVQRYRQKLDQAKAKVATGFSHLKEELGMILDRIETTMCEDLNAQYRQFICLFESTKQLIHQLYEEKVRYFEAAERHLQDFNRQDQLQNRASSNDGLLKSIREQNAKAIFARKYQLFYKEKQEDFAGLAARRRQIGEVLEADIFDYSANNARLRQLKKEFQRLTESLFKPAVSDNPYN